MDGHDDDGDDRGKDGGKHDDDEPGGAVGGLGRRLGDPHGVDKGVRDELDELHVSLDKDRGSSKENRCDIMFLGWVESIGFSHASIESGCE